MEEEAGREEEVVREQEALHLYITLIHYVYTLHIYITRTFGDCKDYRLSVRALEGIREWTGFGEEFMG